MTRRADARGIALPVVMAIVTGLSLLCLAGARMTLQAERAARNDTDRFLAYQAALAALADAQGELRLAGPRAAWLLDGAPAGRGRPEAGACPRDMAITLAGLCGAGAPDFDADAGSVPYGHASGATLRTGEAGLPAQPPRYAIVRGPLGPGGALLHFYAAGYGALPHTRVLLHRACRAAPGGACL